MKTHLAFALLISLAAQGAFAQDDPPANRTTTPTTKPRYVQPYVGQNSQIDAMVPRPADAKAAYGANSAVSPNAYGRYLPPSVQANSQIYPGKRTRPRLAQPPRAAASGVPADSYGSDQWNVGQTYADPNLSSPYSAR
jgi:hypothetical protein